ncbi:MAG: hypothetical protein RDU89_09110 [bacterium]|nr:hypothetical protein [bacterium]
MSSLLPLRDKIVLSLIAGVLGTLVMYSVGIPLFLLNVAKAIYLIFTIEMFVTPDIARTLPGLLTGAVTGMIVGGTLALPLKLIIEWTGAGWLWVKALAYAAVAWFAAVGILRQLLNVSPYLSTDLRTTLILLLQSVIWVLATTFFFLKLGGGRSLLEKGGR